MPIYEFRCEDCGKEFEKICMADEPNPAHCPECDGKKIVKLMSCGSFRPNGIPSGSGGFSAPGCRPAGGG